MGLVHRQRGFTLTEVLVTTVVIGVLAATMLPALMRQTTAADPARLVSELGSLKTGIEIFGQNMRPAFPGDLEDLVNSPIAGDVDVAAVAYTNVNRWKGPYVAQTHAAAGAIAPGVATPWRAGANGSYDADLAICEVTAVGDGCTAWVSGPGGFVGVTITGLSVTESTELNNMIDGTAEATPGTIGLFRFAASGTPALYHAVPYTP
jgi:prepilin-type N-terminal cleavage/methylation domain-containing protein